MRKEGEAISSPDPSLDPPPDHRYLGFLVFLASLSTLIGAALVAYLVVRIRADRWPPVGAPVPPAGLYVATGMLLLASLFLRHALAGIRRDSRSAVSKGLVGGLFLASGFLVVQVMNAVEMLASVNIVEVRDLYVFTFLLLTILHALHVLGGLIPLAVITAKARRGYYSRNDHLPVRLISLYWHVLDAVWIVMFLLLVL